MVSAFEADNVEADSPGGVLRDFDVIAGERRWEFDPGNPPTHFAAALAIYCC